MLASWRCRGQITASRKNRQQQEEFQHTSPGIRNETPPSDISNILGEGIIPYMQYVS